MDTTDWTRMFLALTLTFLLHAQQVAANNGPRASATDPAYLSCSTWDGHSWTKPTARSAQTQIAESQKGYRAYASVDVIVKADGSCENTTSLFATRGAARTLKVVYKRGPSGNDGDGSGIRLIGWSPDGTKLLAEANIWRYESDSGFGHIPLVYDATRGSAKEIDSLVPAIENHFPTDCEFELEMEGWRTNEQLEVKVLKTPEDESYKQNFCVKRPELVLFNLRTETLQAARPANQPRE